MAFIFVRGNTYKSLGNIFRNLLLKDTTIIQPTKSQSYKHLVFNCQQCRCFYVNRPMLAEAKKLYEIVLRGKNRGVPVWRGMTVKELGESLKRPAADVAEVLEKVTKGQRHNASTTLDDIDLIKEACKLFRVKTNIVSRAKEKVREIIDRDVYPRPPAPASQTVKRPAVVTVMGHVDHGKTTLLDSLRNTQVVQSEFGGITQHIGAFTVKVRNETITFMDTPGHAAFTAMRERGARATDIVVLVVAADDGVMEQTVESIRMAKEARVPIIVAVNKVDKPQANIENTLHELINHEVVAESLGGHVQAVPISALTGKGLDDLAEAILAQSEIMDLRADPKGLVEGVVIESKKDRYRGILSTALVQRGTLRKGAILVAGTAFAKVRVMQNHEGVKVETAGPSTPVEIVGWRDVPTPGDIILEVETQRLANEAVAYRKRMAMLKKQKSEGSIITSKQEEHRNKYREERLERLSRGVVKAQRTRAVNVVDDKQKFRIIVKGDVIGSVDAIVGVLSTYSLNDKCELDLVASGVGPPNENEIELAELFDAVIYCFNVNVPDDAMDKIDEKKIKLKSFNVIYHLINDLKEEITSKLPSQFREEILAEAKVLDLFEISEKRKKWVVAGSEVTSGTLLKSKTIRIKRDDEIIYDGPIRSLRHLKDEVSSVKSGTQCGIMPADLEVKLKVGDVIISYEVVEKPAKCTWDPGF